MTDSVAVVTGGAGRLGLAAARILARDHHVVLSDANKDGLVTALDELCQSDVSAESVAADVTDRGAVEELMAVAADAGRVAVVINAATAGTTAGGRESVEVDALGTIHVTRAALAIVGPGTGVVNVASAAGRAVPSALLPRALFRRSLEDPEEFAERLARFTTRGPQRWRTTSAHALSQAFAIWYSARMAPAFGARGAHLTSVSPGATDPRRVAEVAAVVAFCASGPAAVLHGTDVLCDGGQATSSPSPLRRLLCN